jgi:riboflavin synthase
VKSRKLLPNPFNGFDAQKDLVRAFYTWMSMLDQRANTIPNIKKIVGKVDRTNMCTMPDFHALMITFLEFLDVHGCKIVRKTGSSGGELAEQVKYLNKLFFAWESLVYPQDQNIMTETEAIEYIRAYKDCVDFMPEKVQKILKEKGIEFDNNGDGGYLPPENFLEDDSI